MEQLTIQDVANEFEQLLIRILLSILSQLKDEIIRLDTEDKIEF